MQHAKVVIDNVANAGIELFREQLNRYTDPQASEWFFGSGLEPVKNGLYRLARSIPQSCMSACRIPVVFQGYNLEDLVEVGARAPKHANGIQRVGVRNQSPAANCTVRRL